MALRIFLARLRGLLRARELDRDVQEEIAAHVDEAAEEFVRQGLSSVDARREALRRFGGVTQAREAYRDARSFGWLDDARRDLEYAIRALRRAPGFTCVVVLTLALGVGVNTALFSIARQVLLKTLPVPHPEELVEIDCDSAARVTGGSARCMHSYPAFRLLSSTHPGLSRVAAFAPVPYGLVAAHGGHREVITGQLASANLFDLLELRAAAGRLLQESDDRPGAPPVIVLSHGYWMREFGGRPEAVDQTLVLNGQPMTVVGILPSMFRGVTLGEPYDVVLPLTTADQFRSGARAPSGVRTSILDAPNIGWLTFVGRRRPDAIVEDIGPQLEPVFRVSMGRYLGTIPQAVRHRLNLTSDRIHVTARPAGLGTASNLRSTLQPTLQILLVVAALVLLIACANVAALMLAQALHRQREFGLRLALGADRARLLRQVLTESLALALLGGGVGFLMAQWMGPLGFTLATDDTALRAIDLAPDRWTLAVATGLSALVGLAIGATCSFGVSSGNPHAALRNIRVRRSPRLVNWVLASQIALTMTLVGSASLLLQTLTNFRNVAVGFEPRQLLTATMDPGLSAFDRPRLAGYLARASATLAALPGVSTLTYSNRAMGTGVPMNLYVDVPGSVSGDRNSTSSGLIYSGPNFVRTMGLDLLAGRDFDASDREGSERTAIVNESFATHLFGTTAVIGRTFALKGSGNLPVRIIGVVKDARDSGIKRPSEEMMYLPFGQGDERAITFTVRSARPGAVTQNVLRRTLEQLDSSVGVARVETAAHQIDDTLRRERLLAVLGATFSALALLLMAVGLYGVLNMVITRRTREIGVRMALGGTRSQIVWMLADQILWVLTAGVAAGAVGYAVAGHLIQSQLFGITPTSGAALGATIAALVIVAAAAVWVPSRRATRISPSDALRHEGA